MRLLSTLITLSALCSVLVFAGDARARSQRNLAYRPDQAWMTAVRLIRVDMGLEIVERDREARYIIFTYQQGGQSCPATLEIAERRSELGVEGVTVIVSVDALPSYIELHFIDQLERKLRNEAGPPIQLRPPQPPVAQQPEDDDDDDEDEDEDEDD